MTIQNSYIASVESCFLNKVIVFIALFFVFFPWLSFNLNDFDAQPWILFTNFVFIFISIDKKIPKVFLFGYFLLCCVFLVSIIDFGMNSYRGFFTYCIFFTSLHVIYIIQRDFLSFYKNLIVFFNTIWLVGGLLQVYFGPEVFGFLLTVRTSSDRGVTAFSPEPTHYAFFLVFMSWLIVLISGSKMPRFYFFLIAANLFFVIFVAKSSMGFFYAIIFITYVLLINYGFVRLVVSVFLIFPVFISLFLFFFKSNDNRISRVVLGFFNDPIAIFQQDASLNSRLAGVVLSIYGSVRDYLIPHGFNTYEDHAYELNSELGGYFWYDYENSKIMSGTGSLLFELGWIGFFIIVLSFIVICNNTRNHVNNFYGFLVLWVFLLGAIPMSFTLIPAVIVAFHFKNKLELSDRVVG